MTVDGRQVLIAAFLAEWFLGLALARRYRFPPFAILGFIALAFAVLYGWVLP